jgi:hypothetical protein
VGHAAVEAIHLPRRSTVRERRRRGVRIGTRKRLFRLAGSAAPQAADGTRASPDERAAPAALDPEIDHTIL